MTFEWRVFHFRAAILGPTRCQQPWLFHKRFKLQMPFNYFLSSTKLQMNMTLAYWQIPFRQFQLILKDLHVKFNLWPQKSHAFTQNSLFEQAFWRLTPLGFIMSDLSPSWGEWLGVSLPPLDGLAFWSWLWPNRCKGDCWRGVFFWCFCVETWRFESCLLGPLNLKHASSNVTSSNIEGNLEQKVGGLVTLDSWTYPGLHIYDFVWFVVIGKRNQRWIYIYI